MLRRASFSINSLASPAASRSSIHCSSRATICLRSTVAWASRFSSNPSSEVREAVCKKSNGTVIVTSKSYRIHVMYALINRGMAVPVL